ncbi:hypothetical protein HK405_014799, partial [Cladochytrium tenue]
PPGLRHNMNRIANAATPSYYLRRLTAHTRQRRRHRQRSTRDSLLSHTRTPSFFLLRVAVIGTGDGESDDDSWRLACLLLDPDHLPGAGPDGPPPTAGVSFALLRHLRGGDSTVGVHLCYVPAAVSATPWPLRFDAVCIVCDLQSQSALHNLPDCIRRAHANQLNTGPEMIVAVVGIAPPRGVP